jgi:hypothetical protein
MGYDGGRYPGSGGQSAAEDEIPGAAPRPWGIYELDWRTIIDAADCCVLEMSMSAARGGKDVAAMLVRAVNERDAMLALEDLVRSIENDAGQVPGWLWNLIQAALARLTEIRKETP